MNTQKKTAIILGATGLTGNLILQLLLKDNRYKKIKLFSRSASGVIRPKIEEYFGDLIHLETFKNDFIAGAILLQFLKPLFFLVTTTILAITGTLLILFSTNEVMAFIAIFIAGLGAGNLFPLVFSIAMNKMPSRSNEISGLLIMAIVGGAIVPPIMGAVNSNVGIHGSLLILVFCFAFILAIPFSLKQGNT